MGRAGQHWATPLHGAVARTLRASTVWRQLGTLGATLAVLVSCQEPPAPRRSTPWPSRTDSDLAGDGAPGDEMGRDDGWGGGDGVETGDEPGPGDGSSGPVVLPSVVNGIIEGDAVLTAANSPFTFSGAVEIRGNLTIDSGVVVRISERARVAGTLVVDSGAAVECAPFDNGDPAVEYYTFITAPVAQLNGTAGHPVVFRRTGSYGLDYACWAFFTQVGVAHAVFESVPLGVGQSLDFGSEYPDPLRVGDGSGHLRDSELRSRADGPGQSVLLWLGEPAAASIIEYNRLADTWLRGNHFVARNNDLVRSGFWLCRNCYEWRACDGDRSEDPGVVMTDNVWGEFDETYVSLDRDYGVVSLAQNYFAAGLPDASQLDVWDGIDAGCPDALGAYGGPLTLTPTLGGPPDIYGPR